VLAKGATGVGFAQANYWLGALRIMAWFTRDHTGRVLAGYERQFLAALVDLLDELGAPQIDESETALTGEGSHVLIVLIPHRALGGVSIVVWLDANGAQVTWAQVSCLETHDSLDLGILVGRFRFRSFRSKVVDFSPALDCIRSQITGPVTLRCFGDERASILIRDDKGKLREVGEISKRVQPDVIGPVAPVREAIIYLTDSEPPPVTAPSGVDEWFNWDPARRATRWWQFWRPTP
jgi:hypothetical protein